MTKPAYLKTEWTDPVTGCKGYVVIDELIDGMCGGGIRMRPGLNASEVENLARVMTAKFMAMGIPCGGAKGGIDYDPAKADSRDVLKRYLLAHRPFIRECWGTSEDLGTREEDILAILQELDVNTSVHAVLSRRSAEEQSTLLGNLLKGLFLQHDGMVFTDVTTGYGVAVAAIGSWGTLPPADDELDAKGRVVLPGGIDTHCHAGDPGFEAFGIDFSLASRAAALGGVTTLIDMPVQIPLTADPDSFDAKVASIQPKAYEDFALWATCTAETLSSIAEGSRNGTSKEHTEAKRWTC